MEFEYNEDCYQLDELVIENDADEGLIQEERFGLLNRALDQLTTKQATVLKLRFGLEGPALNHREVARLLKIDESTVREHEALGLKNLKEMLEDEM